MPQDPSAAFRYRSRAGSFEQFQQSSLLSRQRNESHSGSAIDSRLNLISEFRLHGPRGFSGPRLSRQVLPLRCLLCGRAPLFDLSLEPKHKARRWSCSEGSVPASTASAQLANVFQNASAFIGDRIFFRRGALCLNGYFVPVSLLFSNVLEQL